jgi:hypothetical protein
MTDVSHVLRLAKPGRFWLIACSVATISGLLAVTTRVPLTWLVSAAIVVGSLSVTIGELWNRTTKGTPALARQPAPTPRFQEAHQAPSYLGSR